MTDSTRTLHTCETNSSRCLLSGSFTFQVLQILSITDHTFMPYEFVMIMIHPPLVKTILFYWRIARGKKNVLKFYFPYLSLIFRISANKYQLCVGLFQGGIALCILTFQAPQLITDPSSESRSDR